MRLKLAPAQNIHTTVHYTHVGYEQTVDDRGAQPGLWNESDEGLNGPSQNLFQIVRSEFKA